MSSIWCLFVRLSQATTFSATHNTDVRATPTSKQKAHKLPSRKREARILVSFAVLAAPATCWLWWQPFSSLCFHRFALLASLPKHRGFLIATANHCLWRRRRQCCCVRAANVRVNNFHGFPLAYVYFFLSRSCHLNTCTFSPGSLPLSTLEAITKTPTTCRI